jgi:hypothetical protein
MRNRIPWLCGSIGFVCLLSLSNAYAISYESMKMETDVDGDGTIESTVYTYYDDCRSVETRADNDGDSVIDTITYTEYDVGNYTNILRHDLDADGQIDRVTYLTVEQSGNEERTITEEDTDGDGTIDSFTCYSYIDGSSSAVMRVYEGSGSYNGGGALTSITYYTIGANGQNTKEESDNDADGVIDEVVYIQYDSNCNATLHQTDVDNDGVIDQTLQSSFDSKCRPIRTELDTTLEFYGVETTSNQIMVMEYTDEAYGSPVKTVTHTTITQTVLGQTIEEESTIVQHMTYEYGSGDCGPTTLCTVCGNSGSDSDNDGLSDSVEAGGCTSSQDADSDDDGISDGVEDSNNNGIVDSGETDPCKADSDGDGIQDGTESGYTLTMVGPDTDTTVFVYDADPQTTTDPLLADTDGDGQSDGEEDANKNGMVDAGESDPGSANSSPSSKLLPAVNLLLLQ